MHGALAILMVLLGAFLTTLIMIALVGIAITPHAGARPAEKSPQPSAARQDTVPGGGLNEPGNASRPADSAAGATAKGNPEKPFDVHDLDGDGLVSMAEAAGHASLVRRFERHDANRDGKLTQTEFDELPKKKLSGKPTRKARRPAATR